jgi:hypothetical protein
VKFQIQPLPLDLIQFLLTASTKEIAPFTKYKRFRRPQCGRDADKIIECWQNELLYDGNRWLKETLHRHFSQTADNPFDKQILIEDDSLQNQLMLEEFARFLMKSGLSPHHCKKIYQRLAQTKCELQRMNPHWLWERLSHCVKQKKGSPAELMQAVKMVWFCFQDEPVFQQNRQKWAAWMKMILIGPK